ncbi:MAG: glycosyltransferase family 39 protein [Anaerolineae bacterium]
MDSDRQERITRLLLVGLFTFYIIAGVTFNISVPLGEAPDENAHFAYVQYVARHNALPVMQLHVKDAVNAEAFQAPAYYVAAALLTRFALQGDAIRLYQNPAFEFGKEAVRFPHLPEHAFPWHGAALAWHIARFFSLALGAITLWATYRAACLLFDSRWLALATVAFVGLNPQFIYLQSMVTNDVLATTVGSLLILTALYLVKEARLKYFLFVALLTTLGILTKPSALTLYPGIVLAMLIAWLHLPHGRLRWLSLGLCIFIPLGGSGWWVLRNFRLYGDPLGLEFAKQVLAINYYPAPLTFRVFRSLLPAIFWQTFQSSWGYFGWLSFPLATSVFYLIAGLHLPALTGLLLKCGTAALKRWQTWVLAAGWLGLLLAFLYYNRETNSSGWHGRFFYPGISIMAMSFVAGWQYWLRRRERLFAGWLVGAGVALTLYAIAGVVLPAYRLPRFLPAETSTSGPCAASFPDGLELVGCEIKPERTRAGSHISLTLYWKSTQEPSKIPYAFVVDSYTLYGDMVILRTESHLARRFPTTMWPVNSVVADRYTLDIVQGHRQVATELGLQVLVRDKTAPDGWRPAAGRVGVGRVIIGGGAMFAVPQRIQARFGDDIIALTGNTILPRSIYAGETLTVTLQWRALKHPSADYQVFVHLLDNAGQLIAQHDGPPRLGLYPTSAWAAGEKVVDAHSVQLPDTYQGIIQPCVGLYLLESMERLPVHNITEGICPERSVPLPPIDVLAP